MPYAIVGILVVAFIVFVVLSAKAWHWSNILFLSLTFLAGLGVLIVMSQVLDHRRKDMLEAIRLREDVARTNEEIETALNGAGLSYEYAPGSLRGLSESMNLELAGRGRVWRHGAIEVKDENRVFKFSGDRIQNQDKAYQAEMKDMQLFVYADRTFDELIYPVRFVGTMRVVAETPNSIELKPVFIADAEEYATPSNTWTLFEKSPADQRDAFSRDAQLELDLDAPDFNQQLTEYRKVLVEQFMPAEIFGLDPGNEEQAREYEYLVDRVLFNGLPLVKIETWIESQDDRIAQRFDPPNEEVFVRYQFNEKSNQAYQVDSDGNVESGQFTRNGQAVDPALHAGGEIEFQKGDQIIVDQLTADGYQRGDEPVPAFSATEPVTEISRVYYRQLNDFPFLLKTLQRLTAEYTAEIARLEENNKRSQQAIADAAAQEAQRVERIKKLQNDQEKLQADVNTVRDFAEETRIQKNDIESSIRQLETEIRDNHRRIKAMVRLIQETATEKVSQTLPGAGE